MTLRRRRGLGALLAGAVLVTPFTIGAAQVPGSRPAALCLPIIFTCPPPAPSTPAPGSPAPKPGSPAPGPVTPTSPASGSDGSGPATPAPGPAESGTQAPGVDAPSSGDPGASATAHPSASASPTASASPKKPVKAVRDTGTPVFTGTPASMGSRGLSFTGLHSIGIVTVPTADGGSVRALKISADSITITGFSLTVRPPHGAGLVTTADSMTLQGHVSVYLGSVTATTANGRSLTLGTDTPPPLDDVAPGLLRVTMGLVGSIADSISYTNTDQRIVEP